MKYGVGDNKSNEKITGVKRRYRMYKDGKRWVIAAAAAAGFLIGPAFMSVAPTFAATTAPTQQTQYNQSELDAGSFILTGTATAGGETVSGKDAYMSIRLADGTEIGVAMLDDNGNYSITIPLTKANYGTKLQIFTVYNDGSKTSSPTVKEVPYAQPGQPTANPVASKDGSGTTVTGTAVPNAHVDITDNGTTVGSATADGNGQYTITIPYEKAKQGDPLSVTQSTPGGTSDATNVNVPYAKPDAPTIGAVRVPKGSSTTFSGEGLPGATITLTDGSGKTVGTGTVDENGHYLISVPLTDAPAGTMVQATQTLHNLTSDSKDAQVPYDVPDAPDATVSKPTDGVVKVTGTAEPNAKITVTPENGAPITTTADGSGNFTALVPEASAPENSKLNVTQTTDGGESTPKTLQVPYATPDKPEVTLGTPTDTDQPVTGKAQPGAEVTVTPIVDGKAGTPVKTTADDNGDFTANIPVGDAPEGATISTKQTTPGGDSAATDVDVPYTKPDAPTLVAGAPEDGKVPVSGTGTPGDTVTIKTGSGDPVTVPVGDDGKFKTEIPENEAQPGSDITAVENGKGGTSDPETATVPYAKPGKPDATVSKPTDGNITVTGTAEPGATVTVTPEGGDPVTATADDQGKFTATIPGGDELSGTKVTTTQTTKGGTSDPDTDEVPYNAPAAPEVTVGAPEDGKVPVSGTGTPGDTVTIKTGSGDPVTVPVGDDGKFKTEIPENEAQPGSDVEVVENGKGGTSTPTTESVPYAKPGKPDATVSKPTDGNITVTGTAEPGATVTVTPEGGDPVTATTDDHGKFTATIPGGDELSGTKVTTTQTTKGGTSDPDTDEVPYNAPAAPEVTVGAPEDGKVPVSGTGTPGDTVTIKTGSGDPVTVPIGDDGKFKTEIPENEAQPGSDVEVVENGKGGTSTPTTAPVPYAVPDAPETTVAAPKDGQVHVTGTVEPGATVTVTPENGTPVEVVADDQGNFATDIPETDAPSGSTVTTTQTTKGGDSTPDSDPVPYAKPIAQQPTVDAPKDGKVHITGTGTPGDTITLIPETGGQISVPVGDDGTYDITVPETKIPGGSTLGVTETGKGGTSDRINADVPLAIPDAPVGQAKAPKNGLVHVEGTAEAGAEVTLTTDSGVTQTLTADDQGNFATDFDAADAPIGSHINAIQKTDAGTSDANAIVVPERPDLDAPDANIQLTKPVMDANLDGQKTQSRLRSASTPVLHVHGYTMAESGAVPHATMNIYAMDGTLLASVESDDTGYFAADIPLGVINEGDQYYGQTEYKGQTSEPNYMTVPYAKPAEPVIGNVTNDGENIVVTGHSVAGNLISVTGTTDDGNAPSAVTGDDGSFTLTIPAEFAKAGDALEVVATNHTAVGDGISITIPEATTTGDDGKDTDETKEQVKTTVGEAVSVTADEYYDNRDKTTPDTGDEGATETPQEKTAVGEAVSVTADEYYDNRDKTTPDTGDEGATETPQEKTAVGEAVSVTADKYYDNRDKTTPDTGDEGETETPQEKTAVGEAVSVTADKYYDNRDKTTPDTGDEGETETPQEKTMVGEAVSVTADEYYDNRDKTTPDTGDEGETETPQEKTAVGQAVSVTAGQYYDNRDKTTPNTDDKGETEVQAKAVVGEAVSVTAGKYYDNRNQTTPNTDDKGETEVQAKAVVGDAISVTPGQYYDNRDQTATGTDTDTIGAGTTSTGTTPDTLPDTLGGTATKPAATVKATTTDDDVVETGLLPDTGSFGGDDATEVATTTATGNAETATTGATKATQIAATPTTAKSLPSTGGQSALPQTGDSQSSSMSLIGLALAGAMSLLGFFGLRKHRED